MALPNIITVFRIFLVPMVVWLMLDGRMQTAFLLFLVAGISDGIDGFIAKRYGWQTELGAHLDPLADKMLLVSIYMVLGLFAHIPTWLVVAVVSRDILIVGAILLSWLMDRPVPVRPLLVSKINTAGQIALAAMVLGDLGFDIGLEPVIPFFIWGVGGLTVISAGAYLVNWLAYMATYEEPPKPARHARGEKHGSSGRVPSKGRIGTRSKESVARS